MKAIVSIASAAALLVAGATVAGAQQEGPASKTIPGKVEEGTKGGSNPAEAQPTEPLPEQPASPADKNAKMLKEEGAATGAASGTPVTKEGETAPSTTPVTPKTVPGAQRQ